MKYALPADYSNLFQDPIDYDVKIIVGEGQNIKEFKLHSSVLISRSVYFKNALSVRWAKIQNGIIIFKKPNIPPSVFEVLIKYIYTGTISIENNEISLVDVIIAADELELLEVYRRLEEYLLENESVWKQKDIVKIYQYDNFTNLYKVASEIINKNPEIIFESGYFLKLEETQLIKFLKRDDLKLEEIKIWEYLIEWGIKNTNSILDTNDLTKWTSTNFMDLEKTLHNCIPHIRFFQMSPYDYTKVRTHFKDILPYGLDKEVLEYFLNTNSRISFNILPPRHLFNSKIINSADASLIASCIDKKQGTPYHLKDLPFKFNLVYRASHEGFGIDKFHTICDNNWPTIVVMKLIKVRNSKEIIDGYNPLEWRHVRLVENERNPTLGKVASKKGAIIWCTNKGPYFGLQDLYIKSSINNNIIGETIQHSYEKNVLTEKF